MRYILTESQYKLITEIVGVPESILDAAEIFYDYFAEDIKSITEKKVEYNFQRDVDVLIGTKNKVRIDSYTLLVEIDEVDDYENDPKIHSMSMGQRFKFRRDIALKEIEPSTTAEFTISYLVGPNWEPSQLYEEFISDKVEYISSVAHELKHKYDKQVKRIDKVGGDAKYEGIKHSPRFGINVIDFEFFHYLYYFIEAESSVRQTEVASQMKTLKITKEGFREFLQNNKTFEELVKIRNFTYDDLINGIKDDIGKVDKIIYQVLNMDPKTMTEDEKVDEILNLVYINLINTQIEKFKQFVETPMTGLFELFNFFGSQISLGDEGKINVAKKKFINRLIRFENNPTEFFKYEIKNFNKVTNNMIKKLSKLYHIAIDNKTNESVIDWGLYTKNLINKNGTIVELSHKPKDVKK